MEKELYREHLNRLRELYPNREVITVTEAARLLGVDPRTLKSDKKTPTKQIAGKSVVPLINLARYMA